MKYWAIVWDVWAEAWARRTVISLTVVVVGLVALYAWGVQLRPSDADPAKLTLYLFDQPVPVQSAFPGDGPVPALEVEPQLVASMSLIVALGLLSPWGILFALILTVGFFSDTFRPQRLYWVLSKPISRMGLLLGRFGGAAVLVAMPTVLFMAAMTALVGWKTGVWAPGALAAGLVVVFQYLCFASVALLVAVWTRSTPLSLLVGIGLYLVASLLSLQTINAWFGGALKTVAEVVYYILPKSADLDRFSLFVVDQGLRPDLTSVDLPLAWTSSVAFLLAVLGLGIWQFQRKDF